VFDDGTDEPRHAAHCFVSLNCYFGGIPCLYFTYIQCFHFVSCSCRLSENGRRWVRNSWSTTTL